MIVSTNVNIIINILMQSVNDKFYYIQLDINQNKLPLLYAFKYNYLYLPEITVNAYNHGINYS